jgi:hypothetical protein
MGKVITKDGPRLNGPNKNGRIYPQNDFERALGDYNKILKENRGYGELGHPESDIISLDNASHRVNRVRIVKSRLPRKKKKQMKKEGTYTLWKYLNTQTKIDLEILTTDKGRLLKDIHKDTFISMRSHGVVTGNKVSQLTILAFDLIPKQ